MLRVGGDDQMFRCHCNDALYGLEYFGLHLIANRSLRWNAMQINTSKQAVFISCVIVVLGKIVGNCFDWQGFGAGIWVDKDG